jgi:hypothetical protein
LCAVSRNVIGIVEKPDVINPTKSWREQYMVKIGVLDRKAPMLKKRIYIPYVHHGSVQPKPSKISFALCEIVA